MSGESRAVLLAHALATRLNEVVPEGFSVDALGSNVVVKQKGIALGGSAAAAILDDVPADSTEQIFPAVRAVLNGVQDCVIEALGEVWPPIGGDSKDIPLPDAKFYEGKLRAWYGELESPNLVLRPISLSPWEG